MVNQRTNTLLHSIGTKILEGELLTGARCQGRLYVWLKLLIDLVAHLEDPFRMALVSLLLHTILSSKKMLSDQILHDLSLF